MALTYQNGVICA